MFVGGAVVPFFDRLGGLVGIFVGAFAFGLLTKRSCMLEAGAAGAIAAGVSWVLGNLWLAAGAGLGLPLGAVGAGTGLVAGALGAYFGGDLRNGLTQDV